MNQNVWVASEYRLTRIAKFAVTWFVGVSFGLILTACVAPRHVERGPADSPNAQVTRHSDAPLDPRDAIRPQHRPPTYPGPNIVDVPAGRHIGPDGKVVDCLKGYPAYSKSGYSYAVFRFCISSSPPDLEVYLEVLEAQYWWGGFWYYNDREMTCKCSFEVTGAGLTIPKHEVAVVDKLNYMFIPLLLKDLRRSATYFMAPTNNSDGTPSNLKVYWLGDDDAVDVPEFGDSVSFGPNAVESAAQLSEALRLDPKTHPVVAYSFGDANQIPIFPAPPATAAYSLRQPATLLIVNNALGLKGPVDKKLYPFLLGDTHMGPQARCEGNALAVTADGVKQQAELYTPSEAWKRLGSPDFTINANYFDVEPQKSGSTWQSNQCSVPLGVYFDNKVSGPTGGTHNPLQSRFLAGPIYFIGPGHTPVALDTMFWSIGNGGVGPGFVQIVRSNSPTSNEALLEGTRMLRNNQVFSAFSGTSLIPPHLSGLAAADPDSGATETTRMAIAFDSSKDRMFIFEGGSYRNGISRDQLRALMVFLDVDTAIELDGGGSAGLVIKDQVAFWVGGTPPLSSCPDTGAWCSPITQPDGKPRPVPGWLGARIGSPR